MLDRDKCGRRIKAAREAVGLTQDQAAELLGVKRPSYAQYELGRRVPSWMNLYELIESLRLDSAILMPEFVPGAKGKRK